MCCLQNSKTWASLSKVKFFYRVRNYAVFIFKIVLTENSPRRKDDIYLVFYFKTKSWTMWLIDIPAATENITAEEHNINVVIKYLHGSQH